MIWKTIILGGAGLMALAAAAAAAQPPMAVEGGRLAEAGGHRMELLTKNGKLDLLLSNGDNKPEPAAQWGGKAVVLTPSGKVDVPLAPAGGNRLSGVLPPGGELAAAIVTLTHDGHPVSGRFAALPPPAPLDPVQVAQGRKLFAENCVSCHGEKLQGQPNWQTRQADGLMPPPPLDETGHSWRHTDTQMVEVIKKGGSVMAAAPGAASGMPAFEGGLTDAQIRAVAAYVKSTWPAATLAQQPKDQGAAAKSLGPTPQGHPAGHIMPMPASAPAPKGAGHSEHSGH